MMLLLAALAHAQESCDYVGLYSAIDEVSAPAILVLGERKGTPLDLDRAERLVGALTRSGDPVTLAFEAIDASFQAVLEDVERNAIPAEAIAERVEWDDRWGFSSEAYLPLLARGAMGVDLVAAGLPYGLKPADAVVAVPSGYYFALSDSMGDAPVPVSFEETLTNAFAWRANQIAAAAIAGWSGEGFLVIVADRALVEGGLGVSWHAARLAEVPVRAVVLANADSPCIAGDRVWRNLLGR